VKIDTLIQLIAIVPREKSEALTTTDIAFRYYERFDKAGKPGTKHGAKMKRVQMYMAEMVETGLATRVEDQIPGRKSPLNRYHLRESQVLSYFLHSRVALNLIWARGLTEQLDRVAGSGSDDVWRMAQDARLSQRERVLRDHVRVVPDGVGREFARIDEDALIAVVEALETGHQVEMSVRQSSGRVEVHEVSVLGLVAKDGAIYTICVRGFDDKPKHFPLHRVLKAEVVRTRSFTRSDIQIDKYIKDQHQLAHVRSDEESPIELELLVAEEALFHFKERPFLTVSGQQTISDKPVQGKWHLLRATVPYTVMLAPFLWSHAGWVQVISPESIRKRVAEGVIAAAAHYQSRPSDSSNLEPTF
jgi:predicted DNA-binding transcriptional regulator YafY